MDISLRQNDSNLSVSQPGGRTIPDPALRLNAMLRTRNGTRPGGVTEPNNDRNKTGPCGCTRLCLALPCGTTEQPVPLPGGRTVLIRAKPIHSDPCGMTSQLDSFRSLAAIRFTPKLSDTLRLLATRHHSTLRLSTTRHHPAAIHPEAVRCSRLVELTPEHTQLVKSLRLVRTGQNEARPFPFSPEKATTRQPKSWRQELYDDFPPPEPRPVTRRPRRRSPAPP